jgi:transglutaminase-like putative cysteine protease
VIFPFLTRLLLYLLALCMPLFHPAIVVAYDYTGWWVWFFLIPGEITVAAFLSPPRIKWRYTLLFAGGLLFISSLIAGISGSFSLVLAGGTGAFIITLLIFKTKLLGRTVSVLEQLFLAYIYYKLLNFSRASEAAAHSSTGITQILLVLTIASFLFHGLALYFSGFVSGDRRRRRREAIVFSLLVPAFLAVAFLLPPDFVRHSIVFNAPGDDLLKDIPYDSDGFPYDRGGRGDENGRQGEDGEEGRLQGLPSDQWGTRPGDGDGEGKQYAVMVVASEYEPVYGAESYYGDFDPVRGFRYSTEEPLNELSYIRLLDTWRDPDPPFDALRREFPVRYFSTIPDKSIPYRPARVAPTILNKRFHPFDYTYNVVSRVHTGSEKVWREIDGLTSGERRQLAPYLEIDLPEEYRGVFEAYLEDAYGADAGFYERIDGILRNFSDYQYELGFDDSVRVEKLHRFLSTTKSGDCTEFSNTAAILGRMAGIPSRVVTGYLASRGLQTFAHLRGLVELQRMIEPLQAYPLESLYLVTTAHHHSWVQYYLPGYGWVDFETTAEAIPPPISGDMNARDVVIPLIEEREVSEEQFTFPWLLVAKLFGGMAALAVFGLYLFRYIRQGVYALVSRGNDSRGLHALYALALMKTAAGGWKRKEGWETALEYGETYPAFRPFAVLYTELRYRERLAPEERETKYRRLRELYADLARQRDGGISGAIRRFFSLRGIRY